MAKNAVRAHAELGASTSKRWMECPGSPREIAKIPVHLRPSAAPNIHADQGTAAHALLEKCLLSKKWKARRYLGNTVLVWKEINQMLEDGVSVDDLNDHEHPEHGVPNHAIIIDVEMCEGVQVCLDHVKEEIARLEKKYGLPVEMLVETKVYPLEEEPEMYGTADIVLVVRGKEIVVIDFKYGAGIVVDAQGNTQMRYYGLGAARKRKFKFKRVKLTIVQPRAFHEDGVIRSEKLTMDKLQAWGDVLRAAMKKTKNPNAKLKAGDWCYFCDAAGPCTEAARKASEEAGADFDDEPEDIEVPIDPEEIERRLKWLPFLDAYARQLQAFAHRLKAADPKALEEFKFVRGRSNRKYRDDISEARLQKRIEKFMSKYMIDVGPLYTEPHLKTPAQVEKMVPKKKRGLFNEKFVVRPEGKIALVPISDKREAVTVNPSDDFDDLDNE